MPDSVSVKTRASRDAGVIIWTPYKVSCRSRPAAFRQKAKPAMAAIGLFLAFGLFDT